jgi:hypothetical protein
MTLSPESSFFRKTVLAKTSTFTGFPVHSVADASFVPEVMDRKHLQVKIPAAANSAKSSYFIERGTGGKRISGCKQICSGGLFAPNLLRSVR